MNRTRRRVLGGVLASVATPALVGTGRAGTSQLPILGTWSAFIASDDPPTRLKLVVEGRDRGRLIVIDQGEIPISRLEASAAGLRFRIEQPPISYDGRFQGPDQIRGSCRRGNADIPLNFVRGDFYTEPPEIVFPVEPLSAARLHELRLMGGAPAMGVGWQFMDATAHVLVDGRRAVDHDSEVTPSDQWHLGSVTKSMTATLVARLVEAGRLDWHATIAGLLDAQWSDALPAYRDVTVLHLLSHRGGLPRDVAGSFAAGDLHAARLAYARDALRQPPSAPLGAQMNYSNADYVVVGAILESLTGKTWEALMVEEVFAPLDLASGGFGPPGAPGRLDQPMGHSPAAIGLRATEADIPAVVAPAGRVHMDLADLLKFLEAHRDRRTPYLREASWKTLHTPPFGGDYALGWSVSPTGVLTHGGTNSHWKSEVLVDREAGLAAASVANVLNNNTQSALRQLLAATKVSRN